MFGNAFKKMFFVLVALALLLGLGAGVLFGVIPALRYDVWRAVPDEELTTTLVAQETPVAKTDFMNGSGKADYIITGQWAKKAFQEAQKYGDVKAVASSADKTFTYIPKTKPEDFRDDADYVYICMNNKS